MKEKNSNSEFQMMFHITFIAILSIVATLLIAVMLFSKWNYRQIICPVIAVAILSCWVVHFLKIGTDSGRICYYNLVAISGILYYGAQPVALTDVPVG